MRLSKLRWPSTFVRRLGLALLFYLPALFLASLVIGWARGLPLVETMLTISMWLAVTGVVIALVQALVARPGQPFWRPLFLQSD